MDDDREQLRLGFLGIENVRNVRQVRITPDAMLNLFYGKNGAGKTSILESITILGRGKGFRGQKHGSLVREGAEALVVLGRLVNGSEKQVRVRKYGARTKVSINEEVVQRRSSLVSALPLRILAENSQRLLEAEPVVRRQFLDWNLFHVEHGYAELYKRFVRCLRQRNAAIKQRMHGGRIWDEEFVQLSEAVSARRRKLIGWMQTWFDIRGEVAPTMGKVSLGYCSGWPERIGLSEALDGSKEKEVERGYSLFGAHRADLRILNDADGRPLRMSRGEAKLMVFLLQTAAESVQQDLCKKSSIILVDDLCAEWDAEFRDEALKLLFGSGCQLFVTVLEGEDKQLDCAGSKMFHVEHGRISSF